MKSDRYPCPCCGEKTLGVLGAYALCPLCHWKDDPVQTLDPDLAEGTNLPSLNEARKIYRLKSIEDSSLKRGLRKGFQSLGELLHKKRR